MLKWLIQRILSAWIWQMTRLMVNEMHRHQDEERMPNSWRDMTPEQLRKFVNAPPEKREKMLRKGGKP
jgi:hypothetical protein